MKNSISKYYNKYQDLSHIVIFTVITLIVFMNGINAYFAEVDDLNSLLHTNRDLSKVITTNTYGYKQGGNYRPFEVLSHQFDKRLFGDESYTARRISNIVVHLLNVILVYFLATYFTKKKIVGLFAGLLFATHIVNGNPLTPVSWISGRVDPLVTLFTLITFFLFIRFLVTKSLVIYLISFQTYVFALWSKEMAVTFPILLVFFLIFHKGIKTESELSKFDLTISSKAFLTLSILLFLLAIILSPNIFSQLFSPDGILTSEFIVKLKSYQLLAVGFGVTVLIIFILTLTSKTFLRLISSIKFTIPYFIILILYLIARVEIIGGIGGNYMLESGENQIFQFDLDSFMRDALSLAGLVLPMGNDYNMKVFQMQIENPFVFYSAGVFITLCMIVIFIWFVKAKLKYHAFFFSWLFITLMPAHNSLIAIGQFQSRYFYLPAVGYCIFVSLLLYDVMKNNKIQYRFSKLSATIVLIAIIVMNSFFIYKTNEKMIQSGNIMKRFVTDMHNYKEKIREADNLIFINFPLSPLNSRDAVFMDFGLHDPLRYSDGLFNYKKVYNYAVFIYNVKYDEGNIELKWISNNEFIIRGLNVQHTYVIPDKISTELERGIEKVYTVKPHAQLQSFSSSTPKIVSKNASISISNLDNITAQLDLIVALNDKFIKEAGKTLFFLFDKKRFRLVNEINFKNSSESEESLLGNN